MQRRIALLLSIIMLVLTFIPNSTFAQSDKGLESAISSAKSKLDIPKTFTNFTYDVYNTNDNQTWNLRWSSNDEKDGSIQVSVDKDNMITNYYHYKPYKKPEKNIPSISIDEAKKISDKFIQDIDKNLLSQLKYVDDGRRDAASNSYYLNYKRLVNGIPFYDNNASLEIDKQTGNVIGYTLNWSKDINFPSPNNIIKLEDAKKSYPQELGLKLGYRHIYDDKSIKPYLVYTEKYGSEYNIDAFTGKKVKVNSGRYYLMEKSALDNEAKPENSNIELTPQELEAIKNVSSLISKEEAVNVAKQSEILKLDSSFNLTYSSLNKNWPDDSKFNWNLGFESKQENKEEKSYVNLSMNASSKEINSFDIFNGYNAKDKAVYTKEDGLNTAKTFLEKFYKDKYQLTEYIDSNETIMIKEENPKYYNFKFERLVNKVPFESNYLSVGYDATTGKINHFNMQWYDIEFPQTNNVITIEKAYDTLFNNIDLELQYKVDYDYNKIMPNNDNKNKEVKLVYALNQDIPHNIDAVSGQIVDYNKNVYVKPKLGAYKDIESYYAKNQINSLKEIGIGFDEDYFYPNDKIKQKDFFRLYIKTLNFYNDTNDQKYIDNMYKYLINEGILKESEKNPDSTITKIDALKFMIRGMGHGSVAEIKGIYNCPFKDVSKESPEYIGYASIGYGLGIVSGNNGMLSPKKEITRGEAAVMIYNYLNRKN